MAKSLQSLTPTQRRAIRVAAVVQFALQGWALADLRKRDVSQIRGSKRLWRLVSFVNFFGPAAYLVFGRKR